MKPSSSAALRALAWVLAHPEGGRASRQEGLTWVARPGVGGAADDVLEARAAETQQALTRMAWRFVPADDPQIPEGVAALTDPPLGLFVRGDLPAGPAVAVVGSRQASGYGREVAEHFGRELARAGVTVVSGMARGVDAAAHRGALAAAGRTVAVWGTGPDRVYPPEHASLAAAIAESGALVTEYPPGSPPRAHHFPERNRILVGLCRAVVVVEAAERSGALITARLALEEGREVLAVPGSVFSRLSAGPNGLLRAGAAPALTVSDILTTLGVPAQPLVEQEEPGGVLALLQPGEPLSADELAALSGQPIASVLEVLLHGELAGRVVRETDGRYRRRHCQPPT